MRFLMLSWRDPENPKAGGAEDATLRHLCELQKRGHETFWWSFTFPGGSQQSQVDGIPIIRGGGPISSIFQARRWVRIQPPFDLIIDQHHGLPWFAPWWSETPCVAYIHEVLGPIWNSFYPWPLSILGRWMENITQRLYRNVPFWTVSESTEQELLHRGIRTVKVFPNGTHVAPLSTISEKPFATPLQLVTVSRLAPNKRVDHAISLLKELEVRNITAELRIVGDGEEKEKLLKLIRRLQLDSKVQLMGRLDEPQKNEVVEQSHFLVHPSVREGWGLNVIEANAVGTPALVYPVAGLVDSTENNVTGLVAEKETPASLADELQQLLETPERYQELRTNALHMASSLQWENLLPFTCDWLESMAQGEFDDS